MDFLINLLQLAVFVFWLMLFGRLAVSLIMMFARDWRPRGPALVLTEVVMSVTDPPMRFLRSILPEITLGNVRFDLSILVLFMACTLTLMVLASVSSS